MCERLYLKRLLSCTRRFEIDKFHYPPDNSTTFTMLDGDWLFGLRSLKGGVSARLYAPYQRTESVYNCSDPIEVRCESSAAQ